MTQSFPTKTPGETLSYSFGLKALLGVGETITSATATISYISGPTVNDTSCTIVGTPTISGYNVSVLVTGGVSGNIYELVITANTSAGQTITPCGYVPIQAC